MIKHLYIHIPFCARICPYCDFNKRVSNDLMMNRYKDKLIEELSFYKDSLKSVETIYIGGGTPSFYPYIEDVLIKINEYINISNIKEFSIESTPETILNIKDLLPKYGINRVSIGVESLNPKTLEYLNRKNTSYLALKNIIEELNKVGIDNINLDFIYSLPFETIDTIKKELDEIKLLNIKHISFYDLIIEEKTKLYFDLKNNKVNLPSEDDNILMRDLIEEKLAEFGFNRYEISNYSKDGYESIHNLSYWDLEDYLGIGVNSHSLVDNKRFSNTPNLKEYLDSKTFIDIKEYYEYDKKKEYFLMGLRKTKGVSIKEYKKINDIDIFKEFNLNKHIDEGLLEVDGDYLRFTKNGLHLGNIVFEEFV